jgi:hypothetical protein
LLKSIQMCFKGAGHITVRTTRDQSVTYSVTKLGEIMDVIIPHFDNYPLITAPTKRADYLLFKQAEGIPPSE